MTGTFPLKRLVLCFLSVCGLLGVYILSVSLEFHVPWHIVHLAHSHGIGQDQAPERSQGLPGKSLGGVGEQWTPSHPTIANHSGLSSGDAYKDAAPTNAKTRPLSPTIAQPAEGNAKSPPEEATKDGARGRARMPTMSLKAEVQQPSHVALATESPFIGDTYANDSIPPQTDCPSSIKSKVPATTFGGRFLADVPVLQWAKHATPEQYQRLKRYSGAHGWGGVDFETLVTCLSVLNSSASWHMFDDWSLLRHNHSKCIRCAVVGNGGILKGSNQGKDIDQHDYVFRTNGAVIKGFEEDVGTRTTHYTFSTNTLRNSMRSYAGLGYSGPPVSQETRYVFLPDHDRDYLLMKAAATHTRVERGPERSSSPPNYFGDNASAGQFKMYHPDFIRYLRNRFLRSSALNTKYKNIYRPSTGATMLLAALHTCDQVSAYGFMTPDYASYSDHYYDRQHHPVAFYINHDLRMEMTLWQQLHKEGLIRLYMRQPASL